MEVLHCIEGTRTDGEHYEYAYRLKAQRRGWRVVAQRKHTTYAYGPEIFVINPKKNATIYQRWDSYFLPWPKGHTRNVASKIVLSVVIFFVLTTAVYFAL